MGSNPNSVGMITRLFHRLPNRKQYTAPLHLGRYFSRDSRSKFTQIIGSLFALPADAVLRLWRATTFRRIPSSWSLVELSQFDDTVNELFARRWGAADICFERSSRYLNWRLFENPRARYSVLAAFQAGEMVAYIAYKLNILDSGKDISIVDWLIDARYGFSGFSLLLQEIIRRQITEGATLVSISPLHQRLEGSLWRLGFMTRPSSKYATVGLRCAEPVRWPDLFDGSVWYLSEANTDLG